MRHLILRGIDVTFANAGPTGNHLFSNVLIPGFHSVEDFAKAFRPRMPDDNNIAGFARILRFPDRSNVHPIYPMYSRLMTEMPSRPYIDALDYIFLKERERGTMLAPISTSYNVPVPEVVGTSDIRPWVGDRNSLLSAQGTFGMGNKTLYDGGLANIKGCKEFQSKITAVFPSFEALKEDFMDKESKLRLPGIVYLGEEDLTLDQDLTIISPGIIICGGSIVFKAGIQSSSPVTIVSLKNMTVETGSPINAHLICLMGEFRAANGFRIVGGLAARSMDISRMKANEKSITFAPAHDPYNSLEKWEKKTAYRYQLSQEEEYYVEGGN